MRPRIAGIEVYLPILVFAIAVNAVVLFVLLRRDGIALGRLALFLGALAFCGLLGAKLYNLAVYGAGPRGFSVLGGYRYPGAVLGVILSALVLRRFLPRGLSLGRFVDAWTPGFALALAIGRVGCLMMSCCHGSVCHLPWAWSFPRGSIAWYSFVHSGEIPWSATASLPVHPLPLYFLIVEVALFALCLWLQKRKHFDGQVLLIFLALHGPIKAALEFLRHDYHPLHQVVLPLGLAAAAYLLFRYRRDKHTTSPPRSGISTPGPASPLPHSGP